MPLSPRTERTLDRLLRPAAWLACLLPLVLLAYDAFTDGLGAEPVEEVTHRTGKTALVLLMATLAVTPVRKVAKWNGVVKVRRLLGVSAYVYACIHFGVYLVDQGFAWGFVVEDVAERPYVTAGFTALLLLTPLAATSTRRSIRRMGKRWQKLHRLVYLAAGLAVLHFAWLVKQDLREPLVYAALLALLLAFRLPWRTKRRAASRPPARVREDATAA